MMSQTVAYRDYKNKYEGKYKTVTGSYNAKTKTIDILVDEDFYKARKTINTVYNLEPFSFVVLDAESSTYEKVSFRAKAFKNALKRCKDFCKDCNREYIGKWEDNKEIQISKDYWAYGIY